MLSQAVQVKQTHRQAFAPCFLGVWLVKNFSVHGLLLGGLRGAGGTCSWTNRPLQKIQK